MEIQNALNDLENEAQKQFQANRAGYAEAVVNGKAVLCTVTSAMVNRGYHAGCVPRVSFKVDGKRVAMTNLIGVIQS